MRDVPAPSLGMAVPLLSIRDLEIRFPGAGQDIVVVNGVDLDVYPGEVFGLIGETGAGKSLTAWASIGLIPEPGWQSRGEVRYAGKSLGHVEEKELRRIRGGEVSFVVQSPHQALNPMVPIGRQIANVVRAHQDVSLPDAEKIAVEALRNVGIGDPGQRAGSYPGHLSGGQAQRVIVAMALINQPRLVIADEPTSGLDVTLQAEILDLMMELVRSRETAIWMITHDMGIIATYCERASVMFAGHVVESASVGELFSHPQHPYTRGLVAAAGSHLGIGDALAIAGPPPNLTVRPRGCQFAYRCPWVEPECKIAMPVLQTFGKDHEVRCFVAARRNETEPSSAEPRV